MVAPASPAPVADAPDLIDVRDLLQRASVEDLAETAEQYFGRLTTWDGLLSKPVANVEEAPSLLVDFGAALQALELVPDQSVLDFGAGSGWTSWMLSQLACRVTVADVSKTALLITEERYRRLPPIANRYDPALLHFDGHRLDLDDASVERVLCFDAFHHVPNPREVLAEFARVLVPGGVCVLMEPGPRHSVGPQSQFEMRTFGVVERDIVLEEIETDAQAAGFSSCEVAVFGGLPRFVDVNDFDAEIAMGSEAPGHIVRTFLVNRRLIRLRAAGDAPIDSRARAALAGAINVRIDGGVVVGTVTNTGRAAWIQKPVPVGRVNLGVHVYDAHGRLLDFDSVRFAIREGEEAILPGTTIAVATPLPELQPEAARLEFDLVSEGICWFSAVGAGSTLTVELGPR